MLITHMYLPVAFHNKHVCYDRDIRSYTRTCLNFSTTFFMRLFDFSLNIRSHRSILCCLVVQLRMTSVEKEFYCVMRVLHERCPVDTVLNWIFVCMKRSPWIHLAMNSYAPLSVGSMLLRAPELYKIPVIIRSYCLCSPPISHATACHTCIRIYVKCLHAVAP